MGVTVAEEGGAVVRETATAVGPWWRRADWGALLVMVVVLASSATSLGNGFAYDDVPIVRDNTAVHRWRWPWEFFTETYWYPERSEALFRPITVMLFAYQWQLADLSAVTFHVVNVTAYAVVSLLLLRLARGLVRPSIALGLSVLWAAHPVHVEVVGNVVGQSELWVAMASLVAVTTWRRALVDRTLTAASMIGLLGGVVVAIGAKESGIVLPAVLAVMWWSWPGRHELPGALRRRVGVTLRGTLYVAALYLGARYAVLGTLKGDFPHPAIVILTDVQRILVALGLVLTDLRLLLVPGELRADYSPPAFAIYAAPGRIHLVVLLLGAGVIAAMWRLHRMRLPVWPFCWAGLALLPTSNLLFPTGVVLAERSLFVPSIGVALAMGQLIDLFLTRYDAAVRRGVRRVAVVGVGGWVLVLSTTSASRQVVWMDTPTLIASSIVEDPGNPRWQRALGMQFLRMQEWERAEAHLRAAADLVRGDYQVVFGMVRVLEQQGRCAEAIDWYARLLGEFPATTRNYLGYVVCQFRVGRYRDARRSAVAARASGLEADPFTILIAATDSMLQVTDSTRDHRSSARSDRWRWADEPPAFEIDDAGRLLRRDPRQAPRVLSSRE